MDLPEFQYFPHDREQLLNTIARFDDGIKVEDVVGQDDECLKQYSNTVLIQVLLEFICHAFVKDENQRERLLIEVCRRLSKHKILNDILIMEKDNELRVAMKDTILKFLKQVCEEIIPNAEIDSSAIGFFEKNLSTESKLYYCKNFIELEKIGQGGFGAVFKAKYAFNRLIYAIKKIPFDYKTDTNFLKVMREANNIATLNHPNIVRYYSAWLEMAKSDVMRSVNGNDFTSECSESSTDTSSEGYDGIVVKDKLVSCESSESSSNDSEQICNKSTLSESSDYVVFSETAEIHSEGKCTIEIDHGRFGVHNSEDETTKEDTSDNDNFSFSKFKTQGLLYIQMEYCDCDLRYWLDKRAASKGEEIPFEMDVTEIFTNILNGVVYIHSKGIIHRDLKPQNIFYSKNSNTLKIGDFGLATLSGSTASSSCHITHDHSSAIGTLPYAAPEQIKSKNYNTKVDIYSLGIILIELMNTCSTASEFSNILKEVKDGRITEEMRKFPQLTKLVNNLISKDPEFRMSAKEILSLFDSDTKVMLREKEIAIKERNMKIREHEATIVKLNLEISRLKNIISKFQIESK